MPSAGPYEGCANLAPQSESATAKLLLTSNRVGTECAPNQDGRLTMTLPQNYVEKALSDGLNCVTLG